MTAPSSYPRFDQCSETCTADCGNCKGRPVAALRAELSRVIAERLEAARVALGIGVTESVTEYPSLAGFGHFVWGGKVVGVRLDRNAAVVLDIDHTKVLELTAEQAEILGAELIAVAHASKDGDRDGR